MKLKTKRGWEFWLASRLFPWRKKRVYCEDCIYLLPDRCNDPTLRECDYRPPMKADEKDKYVLRNPPMKIYNDKKNPVFNGWCGIINQEGFCPWFEEKNSKTQREAIKQKIKFPNLTMKSTIGILSPSEFYHIGYLFRHPAYHPWWQCPYWWISLLAWKWRHRKLR